MTHILNGYPIIEIMMKWYTTSNKIDFCKYILYNFYKVSECNGNKTLDEETLFFPTQGELKINRRGITQQEDALFPTKEKILFAPFPYTKCSVGERQLLEYAIFLINFNLNK